MRKEEREREREREREGERDKERERYDIAHVLPDLVVGVRVCVCGTGPVALTS